jgi:Kef-type K+ transport system membrane component KefB
MTLASNDRRARCLRRAESSLVMGVLVSVGILCFPPFASAAGGSDNGHSLITSIGISTLAATILAFVGHAAKQPLLLAYIAAGVIIGPQIGFGFVASEADIQVIAEIGLILLLFMIGLEIDMRKLKESGKSLILSGFLQFILCTAMGLGFFKVLGYGIGGTYDLLYLAVCCALSSTAIVVKLLYGKFELDTLAGRLTLGILVFQDIWAIIVLSVQPNLTNPDVLLILWSFAKGGLLVVVSLLLSEYVLPPLFRAVAKHPEIVLVASLGWCFFVAGLAGYLGLSLEMGALIAGVAISTFPYNLDVIAKIVSIRDFFITLFFVALGMVIPNPLENLSMLVIAALAALFLIASRFLSIYPLLYYLKNGNRISLLTAINLSQISEFSLVIASLGFAAGHIGKEILSIIVFIFVLTSISSTYMIQYSDPLQKWLSKLLPRLGFKDITTGPEDFAAVQQTDIVLLGFFRVASSLLHALHDWAAQQGIPYDEFKEKLAVIDFNPDVHTRLRAYGIKAIYGDVSHMETLHHAGVHDAKIVLSTIPDNILTGTNNLRLLRQLRSVCPHAKIIVTAENIDRALHMYAAGADYVLLPRLLAAQHLLPILTTLLHGDTDTMAQIKADHLGQLRYRKEIVT